MPGRNPSMEKVVVEGFHYFIEWACYAVDLLQFFATTLNDYKEYISTVPSKILLQIGHFLL